MILAAVKSDSGSAGVVERGLDLARAYGDDLEVLNVMPQEEFERQWRERDDYYADTAAEEAAGRAREIVEDAVSDDEGITVKGRVGEPVTEILDEADQIDATYIVISGRKRSPTGKALFGSTTQSLLLSSDRPIVTVMHD
ncbi:MAG: universal stress protein [Salinigranum sp.]